MDPEPQGVPRMETPGQLRREHWGIARDLGLVPKGIEPFEFDDPASGHVKHELPFHSAMPAYIPVKLKEHLSFPSEVSGVQDQWN